MLTARLAETMNPVEQNTYVPNPDRGVPRADTGSALLNGVADTEIRLVQLEWRFDRMLRPAFDATLRDPIARLVTACINAQRPRKHLALAEETIEPNEELHLRAIVQTFQRQMAVL